MAQPDRSSLPPVLSRADWLALATDEVNSALLRADARRNVLSIVRCCGWSANPPTGRTRPTLARLMAVSGLSRRCVQAWCRWLEQHGLLRVLEPGTTPRFRPTLLASGTGNLAREWQLSRPVDVTCTPLLNFALQRSPARARAHDPGPKAEIPPTSSIPQTRSEALGAALAMQAHAPVLCRISPEFLRHLTRPFFAAGWTGRDVLHALDHAPGGRQHRYTSGIRYLPGWIRGRLSLWIGTDGAPLPSRGQVLAAAHRELLEEQLAARRAATAAAAAAAADPGSHASRAREMLTARGRS